MKKIGFVLGLVLMMLAIFCQASSDNPIQVKEKPAFSYACMSFSGPFTTMPEKIMGFMGEFFKQGLQPAGALISVYHNSPEVVKESELKWDIGFPVPDNTQVKPPLKLTVYEKKTVLEYLHKGSYDLLPTVYQKLANFIKAEQYEIVLPTYEFYLNSPQQVKPEKLQTRIEIPIKRK